MRRLPHTAVMQEGHLNKIGSGAPVGRGFIALYTLAQIGAFMAFLPLLQVMLPLRAVAIDPLHGTVLLSRVGLIGALVASLSNILFGMISDRTRSARGRRRPWLLGGLAATLGSYVLIWSAGTPVRLLIGVVVFQFVFNALFAPLGAVLADYVPERQRGLMSALLGLGNPIGSVVGLGAVGAWRMGDAARYELVAAIVLICVLPFAWLLRGNPDPQNPPAVEARRPGTTMLAKDFALVWISRLLVMTSISVIQGYLLLFLHARDISFLPASIRPEAAIAQMTAIATACNVACGLLCGTLSDRLGRRSLFAGAGAMLLAAGTSCLALLPGWDGLRLAAILYGAGTGLFSTIDLALMIQILPSTNQAGQFLGIMNLCNTLAQIAAPSLALVALGGGAPDFRILFLAAGIASLLGAACLLGVGRKRLLF